MRLEGQHFDAKSELDGAEIREWGPKVRPCNGDKGNANMFFFSYLLRGCAFSAEVLRSRLLPLAWQLEPGERRNWNLLSADTANWALQEGPFRYQATLIALPQDATSPFRNVNGGIVE